MAEREVMPRLPTSGQIIGALVTRLDIKHEALQGSTARRYFSGDPDRLVKDSSREEIIAAIAEVMTGAGFFATPQQEDDDKKAERLASMLNWHALHWDQSRSFLRPRMAPVLPSDLPKVWGAYIRPAVIDLAFRIAAHLHLSGSAPSALELLRFASRTARGDYLNRKRQQAGLSLECLAEGVGVHDHTVDDWMYHGARPSDDNLAELAHVLSSSRESSSTQATALELRALYWISDVASLLAEQIGAEAVAEGVQRLFQYTEAIHRLIKEQFPEGDRGEALVALADLGSGARVAEPLRTALISEEPDARWRAALTAVGDDWIRHVLSANIAVNLAETDDLIEETEGQLLRDWDVTNRDAYDHYRRSQELQAQGKLREALAEVETAAKLDPLDPANHFTIGSVKTGIGCRDGDSNLVEEGLSALWVAVALDPKWALPWTEIGSTLLVIGKPAEAVRHLRNIRPDCRPLDAHYYKALGAACWGQDQFLEALDAFEAALELSPEDTSGLVWAAEIARLVGDSTKHRRYSRRAQHFGAEEGTGKAMELLRDLEEYVKGDVGASKHERTIAVMSATIKLNPEDEYAYLRRGWAHFAKGDDDLAMADLDTALRLNQEYAGAYLMRGVIYAYLKHWEQVVGDMSEAIRLNPDDARAYYHRGLAHGEQDFLDKALADLCAAIRLDPEHSDSYRGRGDCHRYMGQYDEAISDFETALRLDPENAAALLGRGAAYRRKGDPDQAITDYSAVLQLKPRHPLAHRFRGDAYMGKQNYDQAISDCTRALELSPSDPMAHFTRANAHLFSGHLELALADFNAAIEMDPADGEFVYGRGLVRQLMGDAEGAAEDYRRARDLGYDDNEL